MRVGASGWFARCKTHYRVNSIDYVTKIVDAKRQYFVDFATKHYAGTMHQPRTYPAAKA